MTDGAEPLPKIVIQAEAEAEITEAFRWYEDKNEGLGSEFMRALDASLSFVQRNPMACAIVHKQMRRAVLRRFPYSVIYLADTGKIVVLACFHASRNPKQWRDRAYERGYRLKVIRRAAQQGTASDATVSVVSAGSVSLLGRRRR